MRSAYGFTVLRYALCFLLPASCLLASVLCFPAAVAQTAPLTSQNAIRALYMKGQQALVRGELAQAEQLFRAVVARDTRNAGAHANLGVIAMRRGSWRVALAELKTAELLAPGVPGVRLNIGLAYYREGDYRAAIAPFQSVVHDLPQSVQARFLLGLCFFLTERYREAATALKPLWNSESDNLSYLYVLSVAADECGEHALEDQAAVRLLRVGGNSPEVHLLIGKADLARKANDAAIRELEGAAKANSRLPFVHFYLGVAYRRMHEFAVAKQEFQQDLAIDPGIAYTYDELGTVCSYLQQNAAAEKYFHEALRLDSRLASSYYGLAKAEAQEKQYTSALAALAKAGRLDPHSASVHYLRGQILMAMGQRPEAQSEFQIAARMQKSVRDELLREISGARLPNPEMRREELR